MNENTNSLMVQLGTYVSDLKAQHSKGDFLRAWGSTKMIYVVIRKLREIGEPGIQGSISQALEQAGPYLDPDPEADYRNICWHCYQEGGRITHLKMRREKTCSSCNWLICPVCASCRDPEYGVCPASRRKSQ